MATPPGNGLRDVNSVMMEIAFHLVEPCVITSLMANVAAPGVQTAPVTSTVGMYIGAQVVVSAANQSNPTILAITAFDPVALTVTGNFLSAYTAGSILLGGTFPTQQPTDPLFTQAEIIGYIARAQNEFLAKLPGVFDFFSNIAITTGQTFYSLPSTAIEAERVAIASNGGANIVAIVRAGGLVTALLDADSGVAINTTINIAAVADATFDGTYTTTAVSADGLTIAWQQYDGSPDSTSSGGTLAWQILSRLYEVSQQELTMRDPQWFYDTGNPIPTSWYEDRTGVYGFGVAGVPQSNFTVEMMCSIRDSETLLLTDHFICPDIFIHGVKYLALSFCWDKAGEQASPAMARLARQRVDRILMAADRYLRNFVEATQGR